MGTSELNTQMKIENNPLVVSKDIYRCSVYFNDSRKVHSQDNSVHLIVTSPPYFNAKDYGGNDSDENIGSISAYQEYLHEIAKVWKECFRILQPGRKMFINIMNLPIKIVDESGSKTFKTLNLMGDTVTICENLGFIYKREIIWQKTNGVKAHFGSYPYPGAILINTMHEFILEFEKPARKGGRSYAHVSPEEKEASKLSKEFWLSVKNSSVWLMKPYKSGTRKHIAPFPLELPERLIKAYSYRGETVFDPFAGSGTTGLASLRNCRNALLYEINRDYREIIHNKLRLNKTIKDFVKAKKMEEFCLDQTDKKEQSVDPLQTFWKS